MKLNKKEVKNYTRRTMLLGSAAGAALLLTACPAIFVGGVAVGAAAGLDRRSGGAQIDDKMINLRVAQGIVNDLNEEVHVNVNSYNRRVLLTGEVGTAEQKMQAEIIASKVPNVREVVNALAIGPSTSMGSRSNDTYLTGKVKAALTGVEEVSASDVKVITERSVVYLMGIVTTYEAATYSQAVAGVAGVRQVVRVFEVVSEAELKAVLDHVGEANVPAEM